MVVPKYLLSILQARLGPDPNLPVLGILAFEAASAMSRLVSLSNFLSGPEILRLRSDTMRSDGVAFLVSTNQSFLLRLACAELVADLDRAASAAARLGFRSRDPFLSRFNRIYADAKEGNFDCIDWIGIEKKAGTRVKKMERRVAATARLHAEMDVLNQLEASERRMKQWMQHSRPTAVQKPDPAVDTLRKKLKEQRQRVRRLVDESLWIETVDKAADLMAKSVLSILARISTVFGHVVPSLPRITANRGRSYSPKAKHSSGPLERSTPISAAVRHSAPLFVHKEVTSKPFEDLSRVLEPPSKTVGGSGMALLYANVIVSAEKLLLAKSANGPSDEEDMNATRDELYMMLPERIRAVTNAKLREYVKREAATAGGVDGAEAERWKRRVESTLKWLGPVAHDTVRWQQERQMDRQQRFSTRPRAVMLQTLHFADRDKAEAAVVELLVGLSRICWCDERPRELPRPAEF
ncbi:uncharacterized protein LOC109708628 [Ananas comosus]|uniref:Uncharacterized protein LOC109708628 n=1 Tax=Ananas comosus TaxID=4615 RepID=A0A199UHT7_ANACO|nr:uncharacterized protein LOC109708628 [Ananas comosus]OAY64299.1 hypothetical protein ACMD2_17662 [Ananas comosus]